MSNKTIAAIATSVGTSSISVIRVSGKDALEITDKIFKGSKPLSAALSHTVHYGHIIDENNEPVDEVLVTVMKAPKTYTREDVVEISTHGGILASSAVLNLLIKNGAYPAGPGEFTKRAFLNGRIDLSQAEAIIDIINSKTSIAQKNALSQVAGSLSYEINAVREMLINLCASMQVIIDYPDEDLEDVTIEDIENTLKSAQEKTKKLIKSGENGKIIKDGIKTVIAGSPNVGKSSLLNFLAREDRAIVTEIAGTTRDVIEEAVNIDGIRLILTDTAGIRKTDDIVESIGVKKSLEYIEDADLLIIVLDASRTPDDEETELLNSTKNKKRIILLNKTDIKDSVASDKFKELTSGEFIEFSTKTGVGADRLYSKIKELYNIGSITQSKNPIVTNTRHISALSKADDFLKKAIDSIQNGMPTDIAAIDINLSIDALGEITGSVVSEDIVSAIFHGFCVGK